MVDRDHRIPSDAVVQGSPHTSGGKVSEDGGTTTVMWKKNAPMDASGDHGREEKPVSPLNDSSAEQLGDEKKGERERSAVPPPKPKKESSAFSPRLPVGKMKWSQSKEQEPNSGGSPQPDGESRFGTGDIPEEGKADRKSASGKETAPPEKGRRTGRSEKESPEPPRKKKIPVGVLKWRKDEETDGAEKGNFPGNAKLFRLPDFLPGRGEEKPGEELTNAQRRLRKAVKILWIPSLLFGSLLIGLIIGYAGLGDQSPLEVFDLDLWRHIYQLVYG
jgi:hypothetical protein